MQDRIRLKFNPPNVAVPGNSRDLYIDVNGDLVKESPGGTKEIVGTGATAEALTFAGADPNVASAGSLTISGTGVNSTPATITTVASPTGAALLLPAEKWATGGADSVAVTGEFLQLYKAYLVTPEATTVNALAPKAGYTATNDQSTASKISVNNQSLNDARTYWLYLNAGSPIWVDTSDGGLASKDAEPIPSGDIVFASLENVTAAFVGGLGEQWVADPLSSFGWVLQRYADSAGVASWFGVGTDPAATTWTQFSGAAGTVVITTTPSLIGTYLGQLCQATTGWWAWNVTAWELLGTELTAEAIETALGFAPAPSTILQSVTLSPAIQSTLGFLPSPDDRIDLTLYAQSSPAALECFIPAGIPGNAFTNSPMIWLKIGNHVDYIGPHAFSGTSSIYSVVHLPDGLISMGASAFENSSIAGPLVIPPLLTTIPQAAFAGCSNLTSLDLGVVQTIDANAFDSCYSLTGHLAIPDNVASIGNFAFQNCYSLNTLTLGAYLVSIGESAFFGCAAIESALVLPETLTYLGDYAFSDCTAVGGEVTIPPLITTLPTGIFAGCASISGVNLSNVENIGTEAFIGCSNLSSITGLAGVLSIGELAFDSCGSLAIALVLPEGLNALGANAFRNSGILSLVIPSSLASIPTAAFYGCTPLASVTFSEGLDVIGDYAFYGSGIQGTLVLPATLTSIGVFAFHDCNNITRLECLAVVGPAIGDDFNPSPSSTLTEIHVPAGATGYGDDTTWGGLSVIYDL